MYSPTLMRFIQADPTGSEYVDGPNLYPMERDNPINRVDPTGLKFSPGSATAWSAAEAYAINKGWGISSAILQHFNKLSNSDEYINKKWGPDLDLSDTVAASKIGKIENARILKAVEKWVADAIAESPNGIKRTNINGSYPWEYKKEFDEDLYWGLHGVTIVWNAEVEIPCPKKKADGGYTVTYTIHDLTAKMEDDFDFNPGQFKKFPQKILNDVGAAEGVQFHIVCDLKGFSWNDTYTIDVPPTAVTQPATQPTPH